MPATCPKCGGPAFEELEPGTFRCLTPQTMWLPAGAPDVLAPTPVPCFNVFRVGPALPTPCECGEAAVASCRDCGATRCNAHGLAWSKEAFVCLPCWRTRDLDGRRGSIRSALADARTGRDVRGLITARQQSRFDRWTPPTATPPRRKAGVLSGRRYVGSAYFAAADEELYIGPSGHALLVRGGKTVGRLSPPTALPAGAIERLTDAIVETFQTDADRAASTGDAPAS